ncbi:TIGR04222 domain-containing membrane protein [Kitasatospora sp. NPDC088391]|uniref:TIGR04222 domain-containing membrane protein n=1 Tax=Kitasatospora sp. NPDC088391 TaxID=3364074 RepID=UPI00381CE5D3
MGTIGVVCAVVGLVGAGLLRWLPVRGRAGGLTAAEVAGVRGGPKAALGVAVVELGVAGVLDAGRGGRLRRLKHNGPARNESSAHRAVRASLGRSLSLADVSVTPAVRRAGDELRTDLAGRGLRCGRARLALAGLLALAAAGTAGAVALQGNLGTGLPPAVLALAVLASPARTLAGHRLLRRLRRRHPLPATAADAAPEETGLLVALHGRRALRRLHPEFAALAGLLGGRTARDTVARTGGGPYEDFGSVATGGDF